jgi:hypothetical protein
MPCVRQVAPEWLDRHQRLKWQDAAHVFAADQGGKVPIAR